MAYEMYMGNILCPVTPSKVELKIKNQNKTMNLVNGTEVNVLKDAGLTEIGYDLLLPNVRYPFATYKNGFVNAKYFLDEFEKMKTEKKPFLFKLLRTFPTGVSLYDTDDMMVSLESYTIKEDASQGFDVVVSIKLKQFKSYGTKIVKVLDGSASVEQSRETSNSPMPSDNPVTTYTVVNGDCLWNIAKKFYGDGSKYYAIYEANKDKIANPSLIYAGQVLIIPGASQIKSSYRGVPTRNTQSSVSNTPGWGGINEDRVQLKLTINLNGYPGAMGKVAVTINNKNGLDRYTFARSDVIKVPLDSIVTITPSKPKTTSKWQIKHFQNNQWLNIGFDKTLKFDMTSNSVIEVTWFPIMVGDK